MNQANKPHNAIVSVVMITYNHEKFIKEAIEGVLMQKTDFPIQLVLGEDCSTDNTRKICEEYQQSYPDKIQLLPSERNLGMIPNSIRTLKACTGKYIALCEGDDHWTDPLKLQKQIEFLEAKPEYSLTCHRYQSYDEKSGELTDDNNKKSFENEISGISFGAQEIFNKWITKTLTVVFRNNFDYSKILAEYNYPRDVQLFYHILKNGKGYYFNFIGGVYRQHDGGVFSASSHLDKLIKGTLVFKEIAEKNPECKSVYESQVNRVRNKIDGNIFAQRLPFLHKENYTLIWHLHSVCNKKNEALFRLFKLFLIVPKKVLRKIIHLVGFHPSKPYGLNAL